jgi:hypothetical protein
VVVFALIHDDSFHVTNFSYLVLLIQLSQVPVSDTLFLVAQYITYNGVNDI